VHLVDLNVLLYAVNRQDTNHGAAKRWLDDALNGATAVGFAWLVIIGFLRLTTRPGVFPRPIGVDDALATIRTWLGSPVAVTVEPTPQHLAVLGNLLERSGTAANLTNDAHLVALAIEHRAAVCSFDRDFTRFAGVRVITPP
jgi:toxin-antitoxin system PIN domain toxin